MHEGGFALVTSLAVLSITGTTHAAPVTIGSPLTAPFVPKKIPVTATLFNATLPESGASVTSPVSGTIVRWRVLGAPRRPV